MRYVFLGLNGVVVALVGYFALTLPQASEQATRELTAGVSLRLPDVDPVPVEQRRLLATVRTDLADMSTVMQQGRGTREPAVGGLLAMPRERRAPREPVGSPEADEQQAESTRRSVPQRRVTVLLAGDPAAAMIDGTLVAEGDELPRGGRVLRIRERSVLIKEQSGQEQTITIAGR